MFWLCWGETGSIVSVMVFKHETSIRNEKERIIYCTRKRERAHTAHRESYDLRPFSGRNAIKLKGPPPPPPPLFLPQFSSHSISISFRSYFITRSFILDLSLGVPQTNKATMVKPRHSRLGTRKASGMSWTLILTLLVTFTFLILILLALGILSFPTAASGLPKPNDLSSIARNALSRSKGEGSAGERWVEIISWEPRAFVYHNFLTKEECEYLINIAKPSMHKSTVVDSETGKSKDSRVRTSSGTFLARGRDQVVRDIEKRIADFTFVPVEHGEGLQVLHYEVGQKYEPHYDYFMDDFNTKNGGQRIATVLMYLSDVEEGGETVFPSAKGNISSVPWWNELSDCGKKGLSIKPKMGDALLFWSMKPDATLDPSSLHGGCPVIKGDKWSCTKWMRVHEYRA